MHQFLADCSQERTISTFSPISPRSRGSLKRFTVLRSRKLCHSQERCICTCAQNKLELVLAATVAHLRQLTANSCCFSAAAPPLPYPERSPNRFTVRAQTAASRVIGLTLETRPDVIDLEEIARLRSYGCTRLQVRDAPIEEKTLKPLYFSGSSGS